MKILVLDYEWPPLGGGGAPAAESVAVRLVRRGHELTVLTMRYRNQASAEIRDGLTIRRVRCLRRKMETCETHEMLSFVLLAIPAALRLIRRDQPDVIHCHFAVPTGLLAWAVTRFFRVPYIVTCHGSDLPGHNPKRFTFAHKFTRPLLRRILHAAAAVLCPSLFLAGHLERTVGGCDPAIIPNGVDTSRWNAGPRDHATPRLLMSGRLLEAKGMHLVLEALGRVKTPCEVHVAGDGPMRRTLEEIAARLRHKVVFHGWLEHDSPRLVELYRECEIFCLMSERENAPVSLLEAMSCSMAVVAADATGSRETVGTVGFLVTPGDSIGLSKTLDKLLSSPDLVTEAGKKARRRVLDNFDADGVAERYEKLLAAVRDFLVKPK